MRLPKFTAEASLYSTRGYYTALSPSAGRPSSDPVAAQFDYTTIAPDYWPWLAEIYDKCPSPFCSLDSSNRCHCRTSALNTSNPRQTGGVAG
jgi:hypothetical protein